MRHTTHGTLAVPVRRLGVIPYFEAFDIQKLTVARLAGNPGLPGELILCSHPEVVTLGRTTREEHLPIPPDAIRSFGIEVTRTDRGGSVTYHGPGQVVAYPVLNLSLFGKDLVLHMRRLEETAIRALARWGLSGRRMPGMTGVWLDFPDGPRKVCAIGIAVRRWVAYHGLAMNVDVNLDRFSLFVPCGISGFRVTSLRERLGDACPSCSEVEAVLIEAFSDTFGVAVEGG
ncbi:MAG: lipoyl(octanoyl) transferase LipB [Planctomycetota bacterium]|nr:lipoyl(octanoyl) transferase LipB [Planctomycetota bacterium]